MGKKYPEIGRNVFNYYATCYLLCLQQVIASICFSNVLEFFSMNNRYFHYVDNVENFDISFLLCGYSRLEMLSVKTDFFLKKDTFDIVNRSNINYLFMGLRLWNADKSTIIQMVDKHKPN